MRGFTVSEYSQALMRLSCVGYLNQTTEHSYTLRCNRPHCHSKRSDESGFETLRCAQGDTRVCQSRVVYLAQASCASALRSVNNGNQSYGVLGPVGPFRAGVL